ncbi:MAG: rod shape-determining protein MreC [Calditrichaeota bacterium]|nr:rod shape-determining protein MreC [Calditrichota bacterium]
MNSVIKRFIPWLLVSGFSVGLILTHQDSSGALGARLSDAVSIAGWPAAASVRLISLWSENRRLRKILAERSFETAQIEQLLQENDRLRRMLEFQVKSPFNILAAEVIAATTDIGIVGLIIDRGYGQGLANNMAVITCDGLVGRIYRVSEFSATVQLLTDPNMGVAARLARGGEGGILHSNATGRLRLDGVHTSTPPEIGDSVLTSGAGGIFPPNILIGWVEKIEPSSEGWLFKIEVMPSVNFTHLEEVFVVRKIYR